VYDAEKMDDSNCAVLLDISPYSDGGIEQVILTVRRGSEREFVVVEDIPHELYVEGGSDDFVNDVRSAISSKRLRPYGKCRPFCPTCGNGSSMKLAEQARCGADLLRKRQMDTHSFAKYGARLPTLAPDMPLPVPLPDVSSEQELQLEHGSDEEDAEDYDFGEEDPLAGSSDAEEDAPSADSVAQTSKTPASNGKPGADAPREYLSRSLCQNYLQASRRDVILGHELVMKNGFANEGPPRPFIKLILSHACHTREVMRLLEQTIPDRGIYGVVSDPVKSFMHLLDIAPYETIHLPRGTKSLRFDQVKVVNKVTNPDSIRELVFDIETIGREYNKLENELALYPVGVICAIAVHEDKTETKHAFTWRPTKCGKDAQEELAMIRKFFRFVKEEFKPDRIVGFNSNTFDVPYLCKRAIVLGASAQEALSWGAMVPGQLMHIITVLLKKREMCLIDAPGVTYVDLMREVIAQHSLDVNTLDEVCKELNVPILKGSIDMKRMEEAFYKDGPTGPEDKVTYEEMVKYCMTDVEATNALRKKLGLTLGIPSKCYVHRTRAQDVLDKGVGFSLWFLVVRQMQAFGKLLRYVPNGKPNPDHARIRGFMVLWLKKIKGEKYGGGQVNAPVVGLHIGRSTILDFNSLYPSLMRTFNICPSTIIMDGYSPHHEEGEYYTSPDGFKFSNRTEGVYPAVARYLMDARKKIRDEMETVEGIDMARWNVLNALQLAYKLAANGLYGLMGTITSPLALIPGAASVTGWGRNLIISVGNAIVKRNPEYKILYGDTDSVFVYLGDETVDGWKLAKELEHWLNEESGIVFRALKIEVELVADWMITIKKKKYFCFTIPKPKSPEELARDDALGRKREVPKLKIRGLINRTMFPYTRVLAKEYLKMRVQERKSPAEVEAFIAGKLREVISGKCDIKDFRKTGGLSRPLSQYPPTLNLPHIAAARHLAQNGEDLRAGDRIGYYMCKIPVCKKLKSKKGLRAVPEKYVKDYELDWAYYADEILRKLCEAGLRILLPEDAIRRLEKIVYSACTAPVAHRVRVTDRDTVVPANTFSFTKRLKESKDDIQSFVKQL
jgi:DNA polymerase elongation subunit (family B)